MTRRRRALPCWLLAAMAYSNYSEAGVWGMDPVLGVLGDYATDPALLQERKAEASAALTLDAPTTYDDGAFKLSVLPSFRVGDSRGYSSVTSDYEHLNVKGEFDTERSALTASAGVARDSSLYFDYLSNGSTGVRRDGATADLNWDRYLTERLEFDTDANAQRVRFAQTVGVETLTDYRYVSIAPTLAWHSSERGKFTLGGSVARYDSLGSHDLFGSPTATESRSANLQLGFMGQLSELWSVTANAGYSRALNQSNFNQYAVVLTPTGLGIEAIPSKIESAQNGSVYAVNLTHQGSRLLLNASASRQLAPTGFAYLTRQDTYECKANYTLSERWSFGGDARAVQYRNPPAGGVAPAVNVSYLSMSANWGWTEHTTVTLSAMRIAETIQSSHYNVASNEATLSLSHQFNHISFQ